MVVLQTAWPLESADYLELWAVIQGIHWQELRMASGLSAWLQFVISFLVLVDAVFRRD